MKKILLLLLAAGTLATACKDTCSCKTVDCPAFQDSLFKQWIPYQDKQTQVFWNAAGASDTLYFSMDGSSGAYQSRKGCLGAATGCNMSYSISAISSHSPKEKFMLIQYTASAAFSSGITTKSINVNFEPIFLSNSDIGNQGFVISPAIALNYTNQYQDTLTLGGKLYYRVEIMTSGSAFPNNPSGTAKVYLAKNIGIIGYESYPDSSQWYLH